MNMPEGILESNGSKKPKVSIAAIAKHLESKGDSLPLSQEMVTKRQTVHEVTLVNGERVHVEMGHSVDVNQDDLTWALSQLRTCMYSISFA